MALTVHVPAARRTFNGLVAAGASPAVGSGLVIHNRRGTGCYTRVRRALTFHMKEETAGQ